MPAKILSASASPKKSSSSSTSLKSKSIQKSGSFNYALFLHREELRKRRSSSSRVSRTKFLLTHELINKTVRNITKCSAEDLQNLNRQAIFKKNLYQQLVQQKQSQNVEAQRMQKQQQQQKPQQHQIHQQRQLSGIQQMKRQQISSPSSQHQTQQRKPLLQRQNSMQFMKF
ncbi:putative uncharacterized protein DDB_G0288537 [Musca vetustissima]|uniref:putative uncharacterized protein DDB_G0288537 n=1 Tax=Musca vetustissima TaxID=27455 RepID=UPI002AB752AC|nr:putative uncharacterized protein DDB_G0288537 [Musca vetustissima]